jgi:hypothetical protein
LGYRKGSMRRFESAAVYALAVLTVCILLPLIVIVFAVGLLWHEPRIAAGMGLYLLVVTGIDLAAGGETIAEQLVISACSFLAVGVILMLAKHIAGEGDEHQ